MFVYPYVSRESENKLLYTKNYSCDRFCFHVIRCKEYCICSAKKRAISKENPVGYRDGLFKLQAFSASGKTFILKCLPKYLNTEHQEDDSFNSFEKSGKSKYKTKEFGMGSETRKQWKWRCRREDRLKVADNYFRSAHDWTRKWTSGTPSSCLLLWCLRSLSYETTRTIGTIRTIIWKPGFRNYKKSSALRFTDSHVFMFVLRNLLIAFSWL